MYIAYFARVNETFNRCRLATKPIPIDIVVSVICVARTHDKRITSFCRP